MNKYKLQRIELIVISIIAVLTVCLQPPIPLLAIPFVIIIAMRSVFATLEGSA